MVDIVGALVHQIYPNFNSENAGIATFSDGDDTFLSYYNKDKTKYSSGEPEVYARYYIWKNELVLTHDIYMMLENMFDDHMTYVIDWFNKEFNEAAESVTF